MAEVYRHLSRVLVHNTWGLKAIIVLALSVQKTSKPFLLGTKEQKHAKKHAWYLEGKRSSHTASGQASRAHCILYDLPHPRLEACFHVLALNA